MSERNISACFTGIWIESHEHEDALSEIAQLCRDEDWRLASWNIDRGLHVAGSVVPVARTANERVDGLRTWATGRCLDAECGGIYQRDSA